MTQDEKYRRYAHEAQEQATIPQCLGQSILAPHRPELA